VEKFFRFCHEARKLHFKGSFVLIFSHHWHWCNFTAAFTHRSIQQRVCFNQEFHNRSYTTSDVYTFDVSLDFTIPDVSTRRYRALMGNTR